MSDQAQISILKFPENVRRRKEMYLNDPNHCLYEIVDNAIDEHSAGYCTAIVVAIIDGLVSVEDNGRGIPVTPHKDPEYAGLSQAEVAFTVLHAGGKFGEKTGYQTATGGTHGVGSSCVNAVSETLSLIVSTGGHKHQVDFAKGLIVKKMHKIKEKPEDGFTGTEVCFKLDSEIWGEETYDLAKIKKRLRQVAYLNPGLFVALILDTDDQDGKRVKSEDQFMFEDGIKAYVDRLLKGKTAVTKTVDLHVETENEKIGKMDVAIAFTYTDGFTEEVFPFVNNIPTEAGGDHLVGFRQGLFKSIELYAKDNNILKKNDKLEADDVMDGIIAIISVKVKEPKFEGQSKSRIRMPEVRAAVKNAVEEYMTDYLSKHPDQAKAIMDKTLQAAKSREAAARAREASRKGKELAADAGLPGKISDCRSKDPSECELFLVKGDSAAGSCCQGRDSRIQAILPVFGKILNVEKSRIDKVLKNPKLMDMLKAFKCGIGKDFDVTKTRYHKIVLLSDADVDGLHIQCLNLVFFYRYLRPIIEQGYLYIGCPPLFKVEKGKKVTYLYSKEELAACNTEGAKIQRYKGLGEMNPDQLWDTTMNPDVRKLIQVKIDDAESAEEYLSLCMGDEVEPRRLFIMENLVARD